MTRVTRTFLLLLALGLPFSSGAQQAGGTEASAVFQSFLDDLTNLAVDDIVDLFTDDALFWGTSRQVLATDREGVRGYFSALAGGQPRQNVAQEVSHEVRVLADGTQLLSGIWQVVPASGAATTTLRISMVVVERDGAWKIAQFHNSALP